MNAKKESEPNNNNRPENVDSDKEAENTGTLQQNKEEESAQVQNGLKIEC